MLKKICTLIIIGSMAFMLTGCGPLLAAAISAASAYGIYQATRD